MNKNQTVSVHMTLEELAVLTCTLGKTNVLQRTDYMKELVAETVNLNTKSKELIRSILDDSLASYGGHVPFLYLKLLSALNTATCHPNATEVTATEVSANYVELLTMYALAAKSTNAMIHKALSDLATIPGDVGSHIKNLLSKAEEPSKILPGDPGLSLYRKLKDICNKKCKTETVTTKKLFFDGEEVT